MCKIIWAKERFLRRQAEYEMNKSFAVDSDALRANLEKTIKSGGISTEALGRLVRLTAEQILEDDR